MAAQALNCAQGPDGHLLNADQIVWYNDADDDTPIAPPSSGATNASSGPLTREPSAASATTLNKYFTPGPTQKVAGSRRSAIAVSTDSMLARMQQPG